MIKKTGKASKPRTVESITEAKMPASMPVPSCLWDQPGVAKRVDAYWRGSLDEIAHRKRLAALVGRYTKVADSLLEVGCGTGLVYEALQVALPVISYTGIDYSAAMLDIAKERYPEGNFRLGNAEAIDYPDGWFDVAVAFEVFGHVADFSKMLSELLRVAKRAAIFTVWLSVTGELDKGFDHYAYPHQAVIDAILATTGKAGNWRIDGHEMGNGIKAFVIERGQG